MDYFKEKLDITSLSQTSAITQKTNYRLGTLLQNGDMQGIVIDNVIHKVPTDTYFSYPNLGETLKLMRENKELFLPDKTLCGIDSVCKDNNISLATFNDSLVEHRPNMATRLNLTRNCLSALVHDPAHQLVMDDYSAVPLYLDVPQHLLHDADQIPELPFGLPFAQLFATTELIEQEILTLHIEDKLIDVDMVRYFYKRVLEDHKSTVFDISSHIETVHNYKASAEYASVQKNAKALTDWSVEQTDSILADIKKLNDPNMFIVSIIKEMTNHKSKAVGLLEDFMEYLQNTENAKLASPYVYPYGAYMLMQFRANDKGLHIYSDLFHQQVKTIPHFTFRNFEEMEKVMDFCKNTKSKRSA